MGNRCSKCVNSTQSKIITLVDESDAAKALPQLEKRVKFDNEITDDVDPYLKVQLHTAIKKNDPRLVTQILEKREIGLTESIGMIGYDQTALHIAAKYNSDNSMRAILEFIKANQPDKLTFYLRLADSDGNSPPMVCMYHDSPDAFTVLLEYKEHFEFNQRNKKNMTIQEVGKKYSLACLNLLNGIANKNMDIDVQMIQDQKAREAEMLPQQEEMRRQQEEMFRQQEEAHRLEAERAQKEKERLEQELQAQQAAELERARLEALRQQEIEAHKAAELERLRIEQEKEAKRQADLESARLEALEMLGQNQNQPEMTQKPSKDIVKTPRALQKEPSGALQFRYPEILARYHGRNPFQVYFQDPDFPPIIKSLCNDTSHKYYEKYFKTAVWMRPHELLKKDDYSQIKLFDNINPNDVSQGLLGVCYLLSSMSSIAENPPRLQKIFNTKESNPYGVYSVTFYSTGIPTEIIVDDRFPCYENGGGPLFSKPKGDELWVLVLEKAWAKLFGNYCVTEAGLMSDALDALLGAPTELVHIDKDTTTDKVWADFISWEKEEYVLCCATKGDIDQEKTGLVGGHAYTVLGVYELGSHRLLKLRNPWGKFEWKGDFSDNSPLWTVEYKMAVAYTNADDGVFCMTVEDFVKHMDYYTVCYYKDDYHRCHMEIESQARHPEYFEFELEEASLLNIEVLQKDKRHFPESAGYDYSPVEIMLVKKEGNEFNLISKIILVFTFLMSYRFITRRESRLLGEKKLLFERKNKQLLTS